MDDVCVCTKMTHEMGQFVQFILTEIHANNSCTIILFFIELSNLQHTKIDESLLSLDPIIIV